VFDPFFLPVDPGERFCIYHPPSGSAAGAIVYVHPFAEEMNKARRMAALQSAQLARMGYAVLQIDLFGCGDSSGDFHDARWQLWKNDVRAALAWLQERAHGPLSLWGLRLGALLAAEVASDIGMQLDRLLLWQPVARGEQFLTQFLRVQVAAQMLAGGSGGGVEPLREALRRGESLEIAGYEVHPELALAIDRLRLVDFIPACRSVHWVEVASTEPAGVSHGSQRVLDDWRAKGVQARAVAVSGEPFWAAVEIVESPQLLAATAQAMRVRP
jgi:exosortase A-associated hydrolase 2